MKYLSLIIFGVFVGCAQPTQPKVQHTQPKVQPKVANKIGLYCPHKQKTIDIIINQNLSGEYIACEDYIVQNNNVVSTGAVGHFTPTGNFKIQWKAYEYSSKKYPSTNGRNNMNRAMFFDTNGHAIHIGDITKTSHGCVRTRPYDAEWLYNWSEINTTVNIKKQLSSN